MKPHKLDQSLFQAGDIVVFRDTDDNPSFHYSTPARFLRHAQSFMEWGDPTVIHVGLIHSPNPSPRAGETEIRIIDSMPAPLDENDKAGVAIRPLVRNYHIEIYRLKGTQGKAIAQKAVDLAEQFIGLDYSMAHCKETLTWRTRRSDTELNEHYLPWLQERHLFNPVTKKIVPNFIGDGMNCSEFVITAYQLAALSLCPPSELPPDWIKLHAHTSPAKLHTFLNTSLFYEKIGPHTIEALRFSGRPDPRDNSMAIIPYQTTPEPEGWGDWLSSYLPMLPALPSLSLLWRLPESLPSLPIEMQSTATRLTPQFDGNQGVEVRKDEVIEGNKPDFSPV